MILNEIERALSTTLGTSIALGIARCPVDRKSLKRSARHTLAQIPASAQSDWLRGRAALWQLFRRLDIDGDPACVTFPNRQFSLTHAGELAVAAASASVDGIGVDYEPHRSINPRLADWFLHGSEIPPADSDLLRLWTIKESLYKACPDNRGLTLNQFITDAPRCPQGSARCSARRNCIFNYCSLPFADGHLTVAVCRR